MLLSVGEKLGPYEILAPIGAGGMGEVYKARDTRLGRDVAIKVSAEAFSERFSREARVIASLNHPHICQLYDVGPDFLVMELVEGPTLAERLKSGPIPLEESLAIARQIADALEAAHEKGITHRDLKPGNIKIKPDGTVKVLDFGLAKIGGTPSMQSTDSPTVTMGQTQAGVILGTASYMSPEQAKGKPVDQRSDIYAFGLVLYEMFTGKRLHDGESTTEVLASVIKEEPQWDKVPPQFDKLLRRCLEKDPQKRLKHIGDVMALVESPQAALAAAKAPVSRYAWAWPASAGVLAAALVALAYVHFGRAPASPATTRFQVPFPRAPGNLDGFRLSPNGRIIAYTGTAEGVRQIFVHPLDSLEARALPGTENPGDLFWSPDSQSIGFFADRRLKRVGLDGKLPQVLAPAADHRGGSWSQEGVIVFAPEPEGPLYRIPDTGGTPVVVGKAPPPNEGYRYPEFLPDGKRFLFVLATDAAERLGLWVGSLDGMEPVRVLPDPSNAAYVPARSGKGGYLFFRRSGGALMAQRFDIGGPRTTGPPISVADQIANGFNNLLWADLAAAPGVLAYVSGLGVNPWNLVWVDRAGKRTEFLPGVASAAQYRHQLSPDGTKVLFFRNDPRSTVRDLWVQDLARGGPIRLTFSGCFGAAWSPDGKRVAYSTGTVVRSDVYEIPATGAARPKLILPAAGVLASLNDWSRDGKRIVYTTGSSAPGDLLLVPMEGEPKPVVYLPRGPYQRSRAQFSPDGAWMAYDSDESGHSEVYVQAVPASSDRFTVSIGGGLAPRWRSDGKELYYVAPDEKLMAVAVKTSPAFEAGPPRQIVEKLGGTAYAVSPDGQRFLVAQAGAGNAVPPITVVLNWEAEMKR
jgi:Tol biopolymer transport system component/predicted Ser/Thr protein kinase